MSVPQDFAKKFDNVPHFLCQKINFAKQSFYLHIKLKQKNAIENPKICAVT